MYGTEKKKISFFQADKASGEKTEEERLLVEEHLPLVVWEAKKYTGSGAEFEDLISVGSIGLLKAAGYFREDKNVKFSTYAARCIRNEILMYLRKNNRKEILLDNWEKELYADTRDLVWEAVEKKENHEALKKAASKLPARQKEIVWKRFGLGSGKESSQKEVAEEMGISQSCVSKAERKFTALLKKMMEKDVR